MGLFNTNFWGYADWSAFVKTNKFYALMLIIFIVMFTLLSWKPVTKSGVHLTFSSVISFPPPLKYVTKVRVHFTIDGMIRGTVHHGAVYLTVWFVLKYSLLQNLTEVQEWLCLVPVSLYFFKSDTRKWLFMGMFKWQFKSIAAVAEQQFGAVCSITLLEDMWRVWLLSWIVL